MTHFDKNFRWNFFDLFEKLPSCHSYFCCTDSSAHFSQGPAVNIHDEFEKKKNRVKAMSACLEKLNQLKVKVNLHYCYKQNLFFLNFNIWTCILSYGRKFDELLQYHDTKWLSVLLCYDDFNGIGGFKRKLESRLFEH